MTLAGPTVAVLLVLLCAHVALLVVALARALLPRRRDVTARVAIASGAAALVGDLLVLGSLLGRPAALPWVLGAFGLAAAGAVAVRASWRATPAGRAAFYALLGAPLALALLVALAFR